jgi:hypothetical protein
MLLFTLLFGFILVMPLMIYGLDYCIEFPTHDETCEIAGDNSPLLAHIEGVCYFV